MADTYRFMIDQAAKVEAKVYMTKYDEVKYPILAPTDSAGNPWITSIQHFSSDVVSARQDKPPKLLATGADDYPDVSLDFTPHSVDVAKIGHSYSIVQEEAEVAQMWGQDISAQKGIAARRLVEHDLDYYFYRGQADKRWNGFMGMGADFQPKLTLHERAAVHGGGHGGQGPQALLANIAKAYGRPCSTARRASTSRTPSRSIARRGRPSSG